ncbi:MAG: hypothetical protein ACO1RT_12745 [Planctomycetaceae bacterium]
MSTNRRQFISQATWSALSAVAAPGILANLARGQDPREPSKQLETFVPCRQITHGPKHHWFGYYDKQEFDPSGRLVLANQVSFEGRAPTKDDEIAVGYVDAQQDDQWTPIGTSLAWGWQQGCMLQWIGKEGREVLWNTREGDRFVCRIFDIQTKTTRTLDRPIYTLSADGRVGLSLNFSRLDNLRPGYGYEGLTDANVADPAPADDGIWRVDMQTGESRLILSNADVARIPWPQGGATPQAWHYFNHLLLNPSGTRFIFLHRYRPKFDPRTLSFEGNFVTRMLTADISGDNPYVLDPSGKTSHFIWKDDATVTMFTKPAGLPDGFYQMTDRSTEFRRVGETKMLVNGHNTYLPAPYHEWILNDTYPDAKSSRQTVYLYHPPSDRRIDLGHFPSPPSYRGEWRCDTHPRTSADGHTVAIDSPHHEGRQIHLLDIRELLAKHA